MDVGPWSMAGAVGQVSGGLSQLAPSRASGRKVSS